MCENIGCTKNKVCSKQFNSFVFINVLHIPGAFVQFFHVENEEVSLCWKIVWSEMYCSRIGVMCDNIGCTKNKACSKQFCLHQCTRHSSLLLKILVLSKPLFNCCCLPSLACLRQTDGQRHCLSICPSLSLPRLSLDVSVRVSPCLFPSFCVSHCSFFMYLPGSARLSLLIYLHMYLVFLLLTAYISICIRHILTVCSL